MSLIDLNTWALFSLKLLICIATVLFPVGESGDAGGSLKFNNPNLLDSLGLESLEESFKDIHEQESAEKERQFLGNCELCSILKPV